MKNLNTYVGVIAAATLLVTVYWVFFKKDPVTGESTVSSFLGGKKK